MRLSVAASAEPLVYSTDSFDPFASSAAARVFVFVRIDCPITNRYAPELRHIAAGFKDHKVDFWLVYADPSDTVQQIQSHVALYTLPGTPLRDTHHLLVKRAHVDVAPEAAVFDHAGHLLYHGRIDDRYVSIGKARPFPQVHDLEDAVGSVLAGKPVQHPETRAIGCSLADLGLE